VLGVISLVRYLSNVVWWGTSV